MKKRSNPKDKELQIRAKELDAEADAYADALGALKEAAEFFEVHPPLVGELMYRAIKIVRKAQFSTDPDWRKKIAAWLDTEPVMKGGAR